MFFIILIIWLFLFFFFPFTFARLLFDTIFSFFFLFSIFLLSRIVFILIWIFLILCILKSDQFFLLVDILPKVDSACMWIVATDFNRILLLIIFEIIPSFNSSISFIKIIFNFFQISNVILDNNLSDLKVFHLVNILRCFHLLLL